MRKLMMAVAAVSLAATITGCMLYGAEPGGSSSVAPPGSADSTNYGTGATGTANSSSNNNR